MLIRGKNLRSQTSISNMLIGVHGLYQISTTVGKNFTHVKDVACKRECSA